MLVVDDLRLVPTPTPRLTELASSTTNGVGVLNKLLMGSTGRLGTRRGCLMGVKRGCEEVDAAVERKIWPSSSSSGIVCGFEVLNGLDCCEKGGDLYGECSISSLSGILVMRGKSGRFLRGEGERVGES